MCDKQNIVTIKKVYLKMENRRDIEKMAEEKESSAGGYDVGGLYSLIL